MCTKKETVENHDNKVIHSIILFFTAHLQSVAVPKYNPKNNHITRGTSKVWYFNRVEPVARQ
jgi:hypothetical protein